MQKGKNEDVSLKTNLMHQSDHLHHSRLQIHRMSYKRKRGRNIKLQIPRNQTCHTEREPCKITGEITQNKNLQIRGRKCAPPVMRAWGIKKMQKIVGVHSLPLHLSLSPPPPLPHKLVEEEENEVARHHPHTPTIKFKRKTIVRCAALIESAGKTNRAKEWELNAGRFGVEPAETRQGFARFLVSSFFVFGFFAPLCCWTRDAVWPGIGGDSNPIVFVWAE